MPVQQKPEHVATSTAEAIATETAKLNLGEDTDGHDDPFASDVVIDLVEEETVIEDE